MDIPPTTAASSSHAGDAAFLADSAAEWLVASKSGYCSKTEGGYVGDCDGGDSGDLTALRQFPSDAWNSNISVMLPHCFRACALCKSCNYISVSRKFRDCSWYRQCNMDRLEQHIGQTRRWKNHLRISPFVTAAVSPSFALWARTQRSQALRRSGGRRTCEPPRAERRRPHYGFVGLHRVRALRAFWWEVPKAGSTTFKEIIGTDNDVEAAPEPGDVGFAIVRHPACRALSGFRTAYSRAAGRTNLTDSECAFANFPYLLNASAASEDERLRIALQTLRTHGTRLASRGCGFAYHHMLSQGFFLESARLFSRATTTSLSTADQQPPPPPTVLLRLEHLADDLLAFCAQRNATRWCVRNLARVRKEGNARSNQGDARTREAGKRLDAVLAPATLDAIEDYYAPDLACLSQFYPSWDRGIVC